MTVDSSQLWYVGAMRWSGEFEPDQWQLAIIEAESARQTQHVADLVEWLMREHDYLCASLGLPYDDGYDALSQMDAALHTEEAWLAPGQSLRGLQMEPQQGDFALTLSDMVRGQCEGCVDQFTALVQEAFEAFRHQPAMLVAERLRAQEADRLAVQARRMRQARIEAGKDLGQCVGPEGSPLRVACAKRQVANSMAQSMKAALADLRDKQAQADQYGAGAHVAYLVQVSGMLEVALAATEDLVDALDRQIGAYKANDAEKIDQASGLVARAELRTAQAQADFEGTANQEQDDGGPSMALVWGGIIVAASGIALLAGAGADAAKRVREETK